MVTGRRRLGGFRKLFTRDYIVKDSVKINPNRKDATGKIIVNSLRLKEYVRGVVRVIVYVKKRR